MTILHSNVAIAQRLPRLAATGAFARSGVRSCAGTMRVNTRYPRNAFQRSAITV